MRNAFANRGNDRPSPFDVRFTTTDHDRKRRGFGTNLAARHGRIDPLHSFRKALRCRHSSSPKVDDQSFDVESLVQQVVPGRERWQEAHHVAERTGCQRDQTLAVAERDYKKLSMETAQRTVRFWQLHNRIEKQPNGGQAAAPSA